MPLLEVKNLSVRYDKAQILNGVSLEVDDGEFIGLVGPNGAGKSTLLRAVSGIVRFEARSKRGTAGDIVLEGEVRFAGERIDALAAHEIRMRGLVHCPERRRPFRELTVLENLLAGAFLSRNAAQTQRRLEHCFALFPRLAERKAQIAGTLSGGEQQMLATARAHVRREADRDRRALPRARAQDPRGAFRGDRKDPRGGRAGAARRAGGRPGVPHGRPQLRALAGAHHRLGERRVTDGRRDAPRGLPRLVMRRP
jgi:ABC-type branched-subunit amino acid transport system ATPase component